MAKGRESWNKKEREQKRDKAKKQKEELKKERRENAQKGKTLEDMMAYIDENGNISSTPFDPAKRKEIKAEDIEIGVPKAKALEPGEEIRKGIVTYFNDAKGFGFIKDLATQESVFVHVNNCSAPIEKDSKVIFEVENGPKGPSAINVKPDQ
jgi:cold shock CspA family protein